ncbi:hypothetical protein AtEden1_Chr3g0170861 [Arabidopsis thaliana]
MMKTHKSLKLEVNGTFREEVRRPLIVRNGVVYWSCIQRSYVLKCERWEQSKLSYKRGMGGNCPWRECGRRFVNGCICVLQMGKFKMLKRLFKDKAEGRLKIYA